MAAQYSAEDHAKAWAQYYAQQGYTPDQVLAATGYEPSTGVFYGTPSQNAFASGSGSNTGYNTPGAYGTAPAASQPADLLAQSSMYDPSTTGEAGSADAAGGKAKSKGATGKRETVIRKGNGKVWEDMTLVDWDPKWYRLFVGDVSNDVNERTLDNAFSVYPTFCKSKVIRDRLSLKAKYAFIAFKDPEDFLRAWKEMNGKYVGQRPIRLMKVRDDKYGSIATTNVSSRKARELDKLAKNKGKPLDGRPVPY